MQYICFYTKLFSEESRQNIRIDDNFFGRRKKRLYQKRTGSWRMNSLKK
jgi:hypothetical protein